jgi:hypothetical protein
VLIESESVSAVAATSATLEAQIDPLGASSTCQFQYVTDAAFQATGYATAVSLPCPAPLGEGEAGVSAGIHLQSLTAHTTYHYRALGTNQLGITEGSDRTFTTQIFASEKSGLPDGRAWELVSPPDKHGTLLRPILEYAIQASNTGGAMTYVALGPTESEPLGNGNGVQILSTRGPGGWSSQDIAIAHTAPSQVSIGAGSEYRYFSSDLSQAVVQPMGEFTPQPTELSPQATERTVYLRDNAAGTYRALVTPANTPPGTKLFNDGGSGQAIFGNVDFVGAAPDLKHVILDSRVQLTSVPAPEGGVYEWSAGQLQLVSLLPEGGAAAGADLGTNQHEIAKHAVSSDGSRVIWSNGGGLYLRDTNPLSSGDPEAQTTTLIEGATFQTAASAEAAELFLAGPGASEDGSSVYFTSASVLSGEQQNSHGDKAQPGAPNIYLSHAGTTTFIATLSGEDTPDFSDQQGLNFRTSRVSPDGRWFTFMSNRPLTGYDSRDALTNTPDEEVFLYHAAAGEAGTLVCASCNPTGARPRGFENFSLDHPLAGGFNVWYREGQGVAANVPGWTAYAQSLALHQSRYLSDSGRLFFNSSDALVSQDTNRQEDVYQYEPPDVGDCTEQSPTYSPASHGCVGLISSGTSGEESAFLDASASGNDVFFLTAAKLSPQDLDTSLDVYDAHLCTASSPCPPPQPPSQPACEGDACQQPAEPPSDPTPGSLTFHGAGNVNEEPATCPKGKVRKGGKCVARKHKGPHKKRHAHRSNVNRRASR